MIHFPRDSSLLSSSQTGQNKRKTSTASLAPLAIPANKSNKQQLQSHVKQLITHQIGWLVLQFVFSVHTGHWQRRTREYRNHSKILISVPLVKVSEVGIWKSQMRMSRVEWGLPGEGQLQDAVQGVQSFSYARWMSSRSLMYSMVTVGNSTTVYLKFASRVQPQVFSTHTDNNYVG